MIFCNSLILCSLSPLIMSYACLIQKKKLNSIFYWTQLWTLYIVEENYRLEWNGIGFVVNQKYDV
jgi:hypothetical protein